MSQVKTRLNQYATPVVSDGPVGIAPNTPSRNYLEIQNAGANPMFVGFGKADVGYVIYGGQSKTWDEIVPIDSLNLRSPLGTTAVILEGHEA